jgi:hypothetical protein
LRVKGILELLPSRGLFVRDVPTLTLLGIDGDSAGNYHLMDEESTEGMVIPPGIPNSFTLIQTGNIKMRVKSSER